MGGATIDLPDTAVVAGIEHGDHQFGHGLQCGDGGSDSVQGILSFEDGPVVAGFQDAGAVDHNSTRSNNGIVGDGGEQHKIHDYLQCIWNDITFNCHATPDALGDNLRGSVTVNLVNVKDQYEGSLAGARPNGPVILSDRSGNDTVDWNINRWHIENFSMPVKVTDNSGNESDIWTDGSETGIGADGVPDDAFGAQLFDPGPNDFSGTPNTFGQLTTAGVKQPFV